jgi:hypothetical protein
MDDGRGITVLDGSGNGNTGTYFGEVFNDGTLTNGPSWTGGIQGSAVRLDGLNDYVSIPSVSSLKYTGGDMTLAAWINVDGTENAWGQGGYVFSKAWNGNGEYNYGLFYASDGKISFRVFGTSYSSITTTVTVPSGSWHHVAATVNSSKNMKIYIDGIERATGVHTQVSWIPPSGDNNLPLAIGTLYPYGEGWDGRFGGNPAFGFSLNATVDSARVWTRALSQAEIQTEMASSRPVIRPLADWEFEENNGLYANDTHIWVAGRSGTALSFDGVNDYLTIPHSDSLNINKEVTIAAWIKSDMWGGPYGQEWKKVAGKGQWGSAYHLWPNGGAHLVMTLSGVHYADDTTNLPLGSWIHIAGVYNTTHVLLYYNGALIKTLAGPVSLTTNTQPFVIGKDGTTSYYYFNGTIDEVRVFNRTLSETEIRGL